MKKINKSASALHNWKQRHGIVIDHARPGMPQTSGALRKLQHRLAKSIDDANHREVAESALMNPGDLIEIVTHRILTLGIGGLNGAISAYDTYGVATCLQYIHSL